MKRLNFGVLRDPISHIEWADDRSLILKVHGLDAGLLSFPTLKSANEFISGLIDFNPAVSVVVLPGLPPQEIVRPEAYGKSLIELPLAPALFRTTPIPIYSLETLPYREIKEEVFV